MDKAQRECPHTSLMYQNGTYYVVCPVCRMTWTAGSGMADQDAGRVQPKHDGNYEAVGAKAATPAELPKH